MNKGERSRVEKNIEEGNFECIFDNMKTLLQKLNELNLNTEDWFSRDLIKKFNLELNSLYLSFENGKDTLLFFQCNSILSDLLKEFDENLTPFITLDIFDKMIPLLRKDDVISQITRLKQDIKRNHDPYAEFKPTLENIEQDKEFIKKKSTDLIKLTSPKSLTRGKKEISDITNSNQEEFKEFLYKSNRSDQYIKDILAKISQAYELFDSFGLFLLLFLRLNKKLKYSKYKRAFLNRKKLKFNQIYSGKNTRFNQNLLLRKLLIEKFSENCSIIQILDWVFASDGIRGLRNLYVHSLSDPMRIRIFKKKIEVNFTGKSPFKENSKKFDLKTLFLYSREVRHLIGIVMFKVLSVELTGLFERFKNLEEHPEELDKFLKALGS